MYAEVMNMVMLMANSSVISYEVYDETGHSVGCVMLPRNPRILGQDQGTVYLRRPTPRLVERQADRRRMVDH